MTAIVLATTPLREATDEQLVRLPTGDGMALVFHHSAEEPARCALEIAEALRKHPELPVRMGIHGGPVSDVTDVSVRTNIGKQRKADAITLVYFRATLLLPARIA